MKEALQQYYLGIYKGSSQIQLIWLDERNAYTSGSIEAGTIASLKAVIYIFQSSMTSPFDYRCS
jgi:hypothetical protein